MITAIEIENFKAFGERQRIELRPITLLFGPNSGGKSSVLHAIHAAREILVNGIVDVHRPESGGGELDLGGIHNLTHGRSWSTPVRIRIEINTRNVPWPEYVGNHWSAESSADDPQVTGILDRIETTWVEVEVVSVGQRPILAAYSVGFNGTLFATLRYDPYRSITEVTDVAWDHPILTDPEAAKAVAQAEALVSLAKGHDDVAVKAAEVLRETRQLLSETVFRELFEQSGQRTDTIAITTDIAMSDRTSMLPAWGQVISVEWPALRRVTEELESATSDGAKTNLIQTRNELTATKSLFEVMLTVLFVGPGELVRDALAGFRHIGPIRTIPPRAVTTADEHNQLNWYDGSAAWKALAESEVLSKDISHWLWSDDRFATGYRFARQQSRYVDEALLQRLLKALGEPLDDEGVREVTGDALQQTIHTVPMLHDDRGCIMHARDVGVGISQLVPVLACALSSRLGLTAIEQPELHLHPKQQAVLGDLLIATTIGRGAPECIIVETHSEHLILRILRRIRETMNAKLPSELPAVHVDDVAVLYVDPASGHSIVFDIGVGEDGELLQPWPDSFFDQEYKERYG